MRARYDPPLREGQRRLAGDVQGPRELQVPDTRVRLALRFVRASSAAPQHCQDMQREQYKIGKVVDYVLLGLLIS